LLEELKYKFLNPEDEYSPIPFWFWNDDLKEDEIIKQIDNFYEKGVRGFVIHPRIGIPKDIEYLSDRFMAFVKCAVVKASSLDMKVVLYDEAMYPSGSAHGMVVKSNPNYASKALKMTEYKCEGLLNIPLCDLNIEKVASILAVKKLSEKEILPESITKLNVEESGITFQPIDKEEWSVLVFTETFSGGTIRGIHFGEDDGELNPPPAGDLLNMDAMAEFIKLTHDRYYEVLNSYFGKTIIGMFTDEPSLLGRGSNADLKPWTDEFLKYFIERGNEEKDLPLLWFEAKNLSHIARNKYEEAINKRMEETYYKPIQNWCTEHGIALTGHPHNSDDIGFLKYFHIPAQDVVWRWVAPENELALNGEHSTMAKCSSDSARHRGIRRNGNECFACCGRDGVEWSFTADDMKWYMDWLFVRGVNLLYPHAFFYSIDGPRRVGERPPDVGPNNIWWTYYNQISDYMKRMSYLLTDSMNLAKVAVLCDGHHLPWQIVKPLYENQIEFNYLEKELFVTDTCFIENSFINIANQSYSILVIEDAEIIDELTAEKLKEFTKNGGKVILYVGGNTYIKNVNQKSIKGIDYLDSYSNIIDIFNKSGIKDVECEKQVKNLRMSHFKKMNHEFYVFVNDGEEDIQTKIRVYTIGSIQKWDAWKGNVEKAEVVTEVGETYMDIDLLAARRESVIYFINTKEYPEIHSNLEKHSFKEIELSIKWGIRFPINEEVKLKDLTSWTLLKGMEHFSGSAFYTNHFSIEKLTDIHKAELYLGEVYEIADIKINDRAAGVLMWSPYVTDITQYLIEGENKIEVEVKNSLANQISKKSYPSGLVGPVRITLYNN
jgi:hypothetical protein